MRSATERSGPNCGLRAACFARALSPSGSGGRSGDKLVVGVQEQVQRVRDALGNDSLPVRGVLCFLEADWPLIGGAFSVKGIEVVWPRLLIKRMTSGPTTVQDVVAVAARLSTVFPPHE